MAEEEDVAPTLRGGAERDTDTSASSSTAPTSQTFRLVLIRHPYTLANANSLLQGSTDSPLTQYGVQQMEHLCAYLSSQQLSPQSQADSSSASPLASYLPPLAIFTSPLGRCKRLATALSSLFETSPELVEVEALQERDFGQLECTKKGVHGGSRFPKGRHGQKKEGRMEFQQRVGKGFRQCLTSALYIQRRERDSQRRPAKSPLLFLVTHGLWISTFMTSHLGASAQPFGSIPFADNTSMFIIDVAIDLAQEDTENFAIANLQLIHANFRPHLQNVARKQRGLAHLPDDGKQRKLSSFFGKSSTHADDNTSSFLSSQKGI